MSTVAFKIIPQTEKCFLDEQLSQKPALREASALRGERYSFQIAYQDTEIRYDKRNAFLSFEGDIARYVSMQRVENVPVQLPVSRGAADNNFLRTSPGLYPDLLRPIDSTGRLYVNYYLQSVWVDVRIPEDAPAGCHKLSFELKGEDGELYGRAELALEIIPAVLPRQKIKVTQWFHADCLSVYYNTEMFSERHWKIIEKFVKTAADNGINMILTPVFTPPLDTAVGGERPTTQLVGVTRQGERWSFDFSLLERWVKLCSSCGIEYFEISHLFTQWGAEHAPKIMATVDGEYRRVFGWDTDAAGEEYRGFLQAFIPELLGELETLGIADKTVFHISDEPGEWHFDSYTRAKSTVEDLLRGQTVMDALSDFKFYERGAVGCPVVSIDHMEPYLEAGVENLWTYYCCCQVKDVSNRLIAMPTARNRIIAAQFYKYKIAGFLQWGYNFYYTQHSVEACNPYSCTDGGMWVPAGDTFSVYPAPDGGAYESIHLLGFTAALYDLRAMELAESLCGREAVMAAIEEGVEPITFKSYPRDGEYILAMRERINSLIREAAKK